MRRSLLLIGFVVVSIITYIFLSKDNQIFWGDLDSSENEFGIEQKDLNIQQEDLTIKQKNIEAANAISAKRFDMNGYIQAISKEEMLVTLFFDYDSDAPLFDLPDVFPCIYFNTSKDQYFAKVLEFKKMSENENLALSLVLDYSNSMEGNTKNLEQAVKTFVKNFHENDKAEIIKFGSQVQLIQPMTDHKELVFKSIGMKSELRNGTALWDAINLGISNLKNQQNNLKAIVAFSDGGDNESSISEDALIKNAMQNYIPIFSVFLGNDQFTASRLFNISNNCSGFMLKTPSSDNLTKLYNRINRSLRNSYLLRVRFNQSEIKKNEAGNIFIRLISDKKAIAEMSKPFIY